MSVPLPALQEVARGVFCLRAANPSPMTGTGTNTYLLGTDAGLVVVDPGPDLPDHLAAILAATAGGIPVAAILVTHAHRDHSALAPELARRTGAPVLSFGRHDDGRSPTMQSLAAAGLVGGGEGVDQAFTPDRQLQDGDRLTFGTHEIEVLHCPGHMGGHLCFALGDTLLTGDHVMGWASSLISPPDGDMGQYMASLRRLADRDWRVFLPGHGTAIDQPAARLAELNAHRRARETEILNALRTGGKTVAEITSAVYTDTPASLLPAATRNVLAHLVDLHDRNRVAADDILNASPRFRGI